MEELDSGFLLETEPVSHASAGIDKERNCQRKIGFRAEIGDRLRFAVFINLEIFSLEIWYEFALFIRRCEKNIYQINVDGQRLLGCLLGRRVLTSERQQRSCEDDHDCCY